MPSKNQRRYINRINFLGVVLTVLSISFFAWSNYYISSRYNNDAVFLLELNEKKNKILYYDEILTMSARMGVFTGNQKWKQRYDKHVELLDRDINYIIKNAPSSLAGSDSLKTKNANDELVFDELKAFGLIEKKKLDDAKNILFSQKYLSNKKVYSNAMIHFETILNKKIKMINKDSEFVSTLLSVISVIILVVLAIVWYRIYKFQHDLRARVEIIQAKNIEKTHQLALLGEISSGLAHDIVNPLSIISMNIERLIKKSCDNVEKSYVSINKAVELCLKIVNNLKSLSRKDDNHILVSISVKEIFEDALVFSEKRLEYNGVVNIIKNYDELTIIKCRPAQIKQVLINLIQNAADAISKLDERWIRLNFFEHDGNNYFSVTDSGDGIDESVARKIFETQYTTKELGKGTGLGLSISKKLIESMNGNLYYDRDIKNTTFVIRIPSKENLEIIDAA